MNLIIWLWLGIVAVVLAALYRSSDLASTRRRPRLPLDDRATSARGPFDRPEPREEDSTFDADTEPAHLSIGDAGYGRRATRASD